MGPAVDAALELKRRRSDCLIRIAGDGPLRGPLVQQAQDLESWTVSSF